MKTPMAGFLDEVQADHVPTSSSGKSLDYCVVKIWPTKLASDLDNIRGDTVGHKDKNILCAF